MKKQMKLSTKLILGYSLVLALTIVISVASFIGLTMATDGFIEYRGLAREANEEGRVQANIYKTRLNTLNYLNDSKQKYIDQYQEDKETMNDVIDDAENVINDTERLKKIEEIRTHFADYDKAFERIQYLYKERDDLVYNILDVEGLNMRQNLTEIMKTAHDDEDATAAYYAGRIQEHVILGRLYVIKYLDTNETADYDRAYNEFTSSNILGLIDTLESNLENRNRIALFKDFKTSRLNYIDAMSKLVNIITERNDLLNKELIINGEDISTKIEDMKLAVKTKQDKVGPELQQNNQNVIIIIIIVAVVSILIAVLIALIIIRSVNKTLGGDPAFLASIAEKISRGILTFESLYDDKKKIGLFGDMVFMAESLEKKSKTIEQIANGNLTVDIELASKEDEVGNSLIRMVDTLNNIIKQVNVSIEQVNQGAGQVSESSQNLSHGASEQASSLEEITASLNEISAQIQTNTDGAVQAHDLAKNALDNTEKGNKQMAQLVEAMSQVNNSANEIKNIVKIIDDIAFQTNLLALNADIEAARVGKYGKGFAVVANSVRNLASKSQKSVQETTGMVEEAIKNIQRGNELVEVTSKQLEEIKTSSDDVARISNEVSESSQEQAQGIEQISTALSQVEDVVQSNSANAEENAAASEELSGQASNLRELISFFKVDKSSNLLEDNSTSNNKDGEKKELAPYNED